MAEVLELCDEYPIRLPSVCPGDIDSAIGGWLAGLPLVAGPILLFLAMEQGAPFAAHAALATLSGVVAFVAFSLAYSRAAQRLPLHLPTPHPASLFVPSQRRLKTLSSRR